VEELAKENYDVLKKNYYMARKKTFTSSLTLFSELWKPANNYFRAFSRAVAQGKCNFCGNFSDLPDLWFWLYSLPREAAAAAAQWPLIL
jgi:hypothetical protein